MKCEKCGNEMKRETGELVFVYRCKCGHFKKELR
jgi:hypothetical protein